MSRLDGLCLGVGIVLLFVPAEGEASYSRTVSKGYPGFTISLEYRDFDPMPDAPPPTSLEEVRKDTEKELLRMAPRVREIYRHFSSGKHGHQRLRSLLDTQSTQAEHGFAFQFGSPQEGFVNGWVHLRSAAAPAVMQKLAADLSFSEIEGGIWDKADRGPREQAGEVSELVSAMNSPLVLGVDFDLRNLDLKIKLLRDQLDLLQQLANQPLGNRGGDAGPDAQSWVQARVMARVWVAALAQKPCPDEVLEAMAAWPPEARSRGIQVVLLVLSDSAWASGVKSVQTHLARHPLPDPAFSAWLEGLLRA